MAVPKYLSNFKAAPSFGNFGKHFIADATNGILKVDENGVITAVEMKEPTTGIYDSMGYSIASSSDYNSYGLLFTFGYGGGEVVLDGKTYSMPANSKFYITAGYERYARNLKVKFSNILNILMGAMSTEPDTAGVVGQDFMFAEGVYSTPPIISAYDENGQYLSDAGYGDVNTDMLHYNTFYYFNAFGHASDIEQ